MIKFIISILFLFILINNAKSEDQKESVCPSRESIESEIIQTYKNPFCGIRSDYKKCLELFKSKIEQYKVNETCLRPEQKALIDFYTFHKEYELAFGIYLGILNLSDPSNSSNLAKILISLKKRANQR